MDVRFGVLAALLAGLILSGGCGAGRAVSRMRGEVATEEPYGIEQTYDGARRAMDVLKLTIIEDETGADALSAHVTARDSSDTKIYVRLKSITADTTRVLVQVGAFGDESKTRRIQDTIRECLKTATTTSGSQQPASTTQLVLPLPIPVPVGTTQNASTSPEASQTTSESAKPEQPASTPAASSSEPTADSPARPAP
ncbi:MAG: DUF3568 family protein [Solirubrobacterales bacterium]